MLGPVKSRDLDRPVLVSLETLVPEDDFYRQVEQKLELSFVREWVKGRYAEIGRPSIDPVVFFKLQLVLYLEGLRSERQLMRMAADRLSVRWYTGYGLDEPLPDHSTLTRIRERYGLEIFRRFFDAIVQQCIDEGLVWGKEFYIDATKVQANASLDSMKPRFAVDEHLRNLFTDTDEESQESSDQPTEGEASVEDAAPTQFPVNPPEDLEEHNRNRHDWMADDRNCPEPQAPAHMARSGDQTSLRDGCWRPAHDADAVSILPNDGLAPGIQVSKLASAALSVTGAGPLTGPRATLSTLSYGYLLECHARNQPRQAAAHYERAIELNPTGIKAHYHFIGARAGLREPEIPLALYERRLASAPNDLDAHRLLAAAYLAGHAYE